MANTPVPGSERPAPASARRVGPVDPGERVTVSVILRGADPASANTPLSREAFARQFGADPDAVDRVRAFAAAHGLTVTDVNQGRRTVALTGTLAQLTAAFGATVHCYEEGGTTFRARTGKLHVPQALADDVVAVLGLDGRPQAAPRFRPAATPSVSYTPLDLAGFYGFPAGDGTGQCIALIELGGGYTQSDLDAYFQGLLLATPTVVAVGVDGAANAPTGDPNSADGEVTLDIEVAGAIAPGAKIAVYFAPNTEQGFVDAVTTAAHDTTNAPSVMSISWGGPENTWSGQAQTALDQAFQAAAALGITVLVASGDSGSSDGQTDGADHADFPASSPNCTGCGGTSLQASGGQITSETVWNDGAGGGAGGGGVSTVFALPAYQDGLTVTRTDGSASALGMRGVPDVSGNADPATGYQIYVAGSAGVVGGTSAVAPLWAGLVARINATRGTPVGAINAKIYAMPAALNDITTGNNGDYAATTGWDACTGLGSPNGAAVAEALSATAATT